jgi:hypothetical protein
MNKCPCCNSDDTQILYEEYEYDEEEDSEICIEDWLCNACGHQWTLEI